MIVVGIDPGSITTGYGFVHQDGSHLRCVAYGEIKPSKKGSLSECLKIVHNSIIEAIIRFSPDVMVIEDIFYGKNVSSLIKQGHVRGVAVLAGALQGLPVFQYSPLEIKKAVAGYGFAEKRQVQMMVKTILKLEEVPPPDAADALAAAVCHINFSKIERI